MCIKTTETNFTVNVINTIIRITTEKEVENHD